MLRSGPTLVHYGMGNCTRYLVLVLVPGTGTSTGTLVLVLLELVLVLVGPTNMIPGGSGRMPPQACHSLLCGVFSSLHHIWIYLNTLHAHHSMEDTC